VFPIKDNIPTDRFPIVTVAIIVANVLMYLFFQRAGFNSPDQCNVLDYGAVPYEITHWGVQVLPRGAEKACAFTGLAPTWTTPFTSMFMHGGFLHILGNMVFLWVFGNNVEDSMGRVRYLLFYVLGGLAALGGQILVDPNSTVPTLGASGAIAAVLAGYLVLYPRARVFTVIFIVLFFTIVELPAMFFLVFWFAQQVLFGALNLTNPTGGGGGVAYFAHIGGFVFGLLAIKLFATRRSTAATQPRFPVY
jgi:membrane associated rhomboid family serine protease